MQITTGNPATVSDVYDATRPNNGARNPLGASIWLQDSSGRWLKYTYVRLNCTTPPTNFGLCPVYWKDDTGTVVTAVGSEGYDVTGAVAGYLPGLAAAANTNTAAPAVAAINIVNGNFVFIQVAGFLHNAFVAESDAIGDWVIGSVSSDTDTYLGVTFTYYVGRIAKDTALTTRAIGMELVASVSTDQGDINIFIDP